VPGGQPGILFHTKMSNICSTGSGYGRCEHLFPQNIRFGIFPFGNIKHVVSELELVAYLIFIVSEVKLPAAFNSLHFELSIIQFCILKVYH
jgi:hypothetical protein